MDNCTPTFDRRIELTLRAPDDPAIVVGNPGQLEQVFLNMALNARDAVSAPTVVDPKIHFVAVNVPETAASGALVRVLIRDNGVGMNERTRQRAFEPFFTTKEIGRVEGTDRSGFVLDESSDGTSGLRPP
jgi:signal transduction histidine kinase